MTDEMLIVFGILAGAVGLFAWGRPRVDIVAILVVLALMLSRVLTPQESLAGFGDPGSFLVVLKQVTDLLHAFLRGPVGDDFSTRLEHLVQVLLPVGHQERADSRRLVESHVVGIRAGELDVIVD